MPGEIPASKGKGFAREMRSVLTPSPVREFWHKEDESIHPFSHWSGEEKKKRKIRKKKKKEWRKKRERKKEGGNSNPTWLE